MIVDPPYALFVCCIFKHADGTINMFPFLFDEFLNFIKNAVETIHLELYLF